MRVERHDQFRRRDARPDSEIHCVVANHPAQEQIQPLAGAATRRARKKIRHTGTRLPIAVRRAKVGPHRSRGKRFERLGQVGCARIVPVEKERLDRSFLQHSLKNDDERRQIVPLRPAVNDWLQIARLPHRIERSDVRRGRPPHHGKQALERLQHARDTSERERSSAECCDLAIRWIFKAPYELNGVGRGIDAIERGVKPVEPQLERVCPRAAQATFISHAIY
jgi:hypothetical protein